MKKLDKRVAVVTGGGSGIGAASARAFAAQGVAVAIVGRTPDKLNRVAEAVVSEGGTAMTVPADLFDADAPKTVIDTVAAAWGRIDYLVNCAAAIDHKNVEDATVQLFDEHMAVNVRAPYFLVQNALPFLRESDCASVVNISSSSAMLTIPGQSMYGTSKAAIQYLTKSFAAELAPKIRFNCIAPGPIDTPIHLVWAGNDVAGAYARMTKELPLARMGRPEEVAAWVVWLCSDKSSFVTGNIIAVDGGQTLPGALSKICD